MNENFLHTIWNHQLILSKELVTTSGIDITLINKGILNKHDGPDFLEAKLKLGETLWAGNIEIHVNSSDWIKHRHDENPRYKNIILHIVWNNDVDLDISVETLELKGLVPKIYLDNYQQLLSSKEDKLPCSAFIPEIPTAYIQFYRQKLLLERYTEKRKFIHELFPNSDKQSIVFGYFSYCFGLKENAENFLKLSETIPYNSLQKIKHQPLAIESILFGQAGFLEPHFEEEYPRTLQKEYTYWKNILPIKGSLPIYWNFLRIRPISFPTLRLAFLAQVLEKQPSLENLVFDSTYSEFHQFITQLQLDNFWNTHYHFKKTSKPKEKKLSKAFAEKLWINAVLPLRFYFSNNPDFELEKIIDQLEKIKKENNSITRKMENNGFANKHAAHSQSNLHLYKTKCFPRNCLNCDVGVKILKRI
jgi:hypothetical protein